MSSVHLAPRHRVARSRRPPTVTALLSTVVVLALVSAPYVVYADITSLLVNLFILLVLATTWNLLAGYAGLISVGQQAYVGIGAYTVLVLAQNGVSPYLAIPVAAAVCAAAALPISLLVFRLRNEYFAIGTWVVAEALLLIAVRFPSLGGGTGASLPGLSGFDPALRQAFTYWAALAVVVATLVGAYLLLRSRVGLDLTAIRDDEVGAASVGVRVSRAKRIVYLAAAAGGGAAGALLAVSQLNVLAGNVFSVQWSAYMIFVAVIGGVGTIEGPILGTAIFFTLQHTLAQNGAWYLILVGGIAVVVAMYAPRGLWGLVADRFDLRLFPVGYYLHDERVEPP
ncbi:MAG TPA: branched-chain amino acid ABC transporter permease [Candidatus Dormibacteraeota bacterium]|nr:branched-chain amino acid ABC transporter permease [Candidatus Dormibacteraeota bacterium]